MQSEWKVTQNAINGAKMYAVHRLRNIAEPQHSGNMEFATEYMESKDEAIIIAQKMNEVKNESNR